MKTWFAAVSAVVALTATTGAQPPPSPQMLQSKGWLTDYPPARAEAKRTGKPLMVVFRCVP